MIEECAKLAKIIGNDAYVTSNDVLISKFRRDWVNVSGYVITNLNIDTTVLKCYGWSYQENTDSWFGPVYRPRKLQ